MEQTTTGRPRKYTCLSHSSRSSDFLSFFVLLDHCGVPVNRFFYTFYLPRLVSTSSKPKCGIRIGFGEGFCVAHRSYGFQKVEKVLLCNLNCVG